MHIKGRFIKFCYSACATNDNYQLRIHVNHCKRNFTDNRFLKQNNAVGTSKIIAFVYFLPGIVSNPSKHRKQTSWS